MRRCLILLMLLTIPAEAFAQVPPAAAAAAGASLLERIFGHRNPRAYTGCGSNSHATLDMFGNKGCAPGGPYKAKKQRGAVEACAMGSVKMGDGSCRRVPGARTK